MRIVVFGPEQRVGALVGERIVDLGWTRLDEFIAQGKPALDEAEKRLHQTEGIAAQGVKLHAPWPRRRVAMSGGNYAAHFAGIQKHAYQRDLGASLQNAVAEARKLGQFGFYKVLDELAGPDDDVPMPTRSKYFDYEGEASIVIGKRGKDIPAARIEEYVWGVTLMNDWTIRESQTPRALQYNVTKNFDRGASIGPCIVVGEHDFRNIDVQTRVNGALRQSFNTRDMIFSFGEILEHLSRDFTFVPGDIISGGTGAGTAGDMSPRLPDGSRPLELFLKPGDVVEVSSPQIGAIRNRIVPA